MIISHNAAGGGAGDNTEVVDELQTANIKLETGNTNETSLLGKIDLLNGKIDTANTRLNSIIAADFGLPKVIKAGEAVDNSNYKLIVVQSEGTIFTGLQDTSGINLVTQKNFAAYACAAGARICSSSSANTLTAITVSVGSVFAYV